VTAALLESRRVHLRHPRAERDAVRDVTVAVAPGEIVALVGPNGSGKSTLLAGLGRELPPRSGRIHFAGEDAFRIPRRRFSRRVGRLPQEPACPEGVPVEALDLRTRKLETLSGGERRRAWLAMVLAQEAEALLLDEPTSALDLRHQWEVLDLLERANRERRLTLVLSLHDLEQAASLAHRLVVMHRGRGCAAGPPAESLSEEMLRDVFGVEARVDKEDGVLRVRVRGPGDALRSL